MELESIARADYVMDKFARDSRSAGSRIPRQVAVANFFILHTLCPLQLTVIVAQDVFDVPWVPNDTLFDLSVAPPCNAGFDGDEMNMHVPQSKETRDHQ
ncbi:DNA-directed RNA polymerase subunit A [Sanghuangporus baumii]|uniref:DNA-directed RNA polymerase subunit A n=1 Tax=Sanghuangporus baumii TaxID=108892 RepID=A0A9Q5N9P1_SANBA|nr:DNA-directed RNA polymerase subunit A [Sanghuangporus baumii]